LGLLKPPGKGRLESRETRRALGQRQLRAIYSWRHMVKGTTPPAPPKGVLLAGEFKVFISHGKNMAIVDQVKDVLTLYDIDYEIAVEEETAAIPVPTKVMATMRRCQAGIVVVTADEQNKNGDGYSINTNVLIEIGAAFVLYDQGVILVWDRRLKVPSNLQGLYRIDFEGDELSFATGTKLAKAVKSLRKGPVAG
jgi:predicted nucleotide-binding protein